MLRVDCRVFADGLGSWLVDNKNGVKMARLLCIEIEMQRFPEHLIANSIMEHADHAAR
jgi:hypothetical protein